MLEKNKKYLLKPLKPSMKEKKRYLFIQGKELRKNVEQSILDFIGILGLAKTNLNWIKSQGDKGIISVDREMLDYVRACFCVYSEKIEILKVSGTLKGLDYK